MIWNRKVPVDALLAALKEMFWVTGFPPAGTLITADAGPVIPGGLEKVTITSPEKPFLGVTVTGSTIDPPCRTLKVPVDDKSKEATEGVICPPGPGGPPSVGSD